MGPLLNELGTLVLEGTEKAEIQNVAFALVFTVQACLAAPAVLGEPSDLTLPCKGDVSHALGSGMS